MIFHYTVSSPFLNLSKTRQLDGVTKKKRSKSVIVGGSDFKDVTHLYRITVTSGRNKIKTLGINQDGIIYELDFTKSVSVLLGLKMTSRRTQSNIR